MTRGAEHFETARTLGVELEKKPAERIVIIGMSALTPLGNTEQTLEGLNTGKSGIKPFNVNNFATNIAGTVDFDPEKYFSKKEMKEKSRLNAMTVVVCREAMGKAGLLGEDGKLRKDINRRDVATWTGSAFGSGNLVIDVNNKIHENDNPTDTSDERSIKMTEGSKRVPVRSGLKLFPEELNGGVAMDFGLSGWGGSSVEACATGLSNIVEAAEAIKSGRAKIVIAGGFEDVLTEHSEIGLSLFAAMRSVLSTRNSDPERASRPFDKDRDGFVLSAGGAAVVLAELNYALKIGAPILGEVLGFQKSMDGSDPTNLNKEIVAGTILGALYNEKAKGFYDVDAIFAHATSTKEGDLAEAAVLRIIFGEDLKNIPITAIKSNVGHLAGGAGAINIVAALNALNVGKIPQIVNLENPDPEVADLNFVRGEALVKDIKTALVLAYGFGGHNSVMLLGKYEK
ncbi:MAG: beta-ketoacyl-[acyl-carrier-protein] synthase family protein [Candidatus Levybacteria bacterium]|nr:beta-ketoacyl-[acyl-carrier-protein] synthase family protein [Candidatus Levybacteria bacterium]MDZ4228181.1 beta-ketoacyl-[acyl-carrier-protein] synthase family protein [Candidatus Levybacteria bacterium]